MFKLKKGLTFLSMIFLVNACGALEDHTSSKSSLQWIKSRGLNQYAYITKEDVSYRGNVGDDFLMGVNVIEVNGVTSSALNASIYPQIVKLHLVKEDQEQTIQVKKNNKTLLTFNVNIHNGYYEVDFASMKNDLKFMSMVNKVGARNSGHSTWKSVGTPLVKKIFQDQDTLVVNLQHSIIQYNYLGQAIKKGNLTLAFYLKRQKALPKLKTADQRRVAEGKKQSLGFFGSSLFITKEEEKTSPIQRFPKKKEGSEPHIFYLKNFPTAFIDTAKSAVESWNQAFGYTFLKVKIAGSEIDAGNPFFNVIKWFDHTDKTIGWVGVAKPLVDPKTGLVMSASVYIQGSKLIEDLQQIHKNAQKGNRNNIAGGALGGASFYIQPGESPVIPFMQNPSQDWNDFIKKFYYEVIVHEMGHVLGLRHNFKGSTLEGPNGESSSIMDYLPLSEHTINHNPGVYDIAAIKWGYQGLKPMQKYPYCSDEERISWKEWNCNMGDMGNPINYVVEGLKQGTNIVGSFHAKITNKGLLSSMIKTIELAHKMWKLKTTMTDYQQDQIKNALPAAYKFFWQHEGDNQQESSSNLKLMRDMAEKRINQLKQQGLI